MDKKREQRIMKKLIIFILLSLLPCMAHAKHYQWVENGIHHFSNFQKPPGQRGVFTLTQQPPPAPVAEKKEAQIDETIKEIEARDDKVEALKETYLKPGAEAVKNILQLILPESK